MRILRLFFCLAVLQLTLPASATPIHYKSWVVTDAVTTGLYGPGQLYGYIPVSTDIFATVGRAHLVLKTDVGWFRFHGVPVVTYGSEDNITMKWSDRYATLYLTVNNDAIDKYNLPILICTSTVTYCQPEVAHVDLTYPGTSTDVFTSGELVPATEPSSLLLLSTGALSALGLARRRYIA